MKARFRYRAWKARLVGERLEIAVLRALVRPGHVVADAGANKGAYLYWLRNAVGADGRVLAFEPQPSLASYLRDACSRFDWTNVLVRPVALSNRSGTATLHVPGTGQSPAASLRPAANRDTSGQAVECRVETLDSEMRSAGGRLRFLKADVEGHELALFEGALRTLQRDRPRLLFECERRHLEGHTMGDVFSFLEKLLYRGYLVTDSSLLPLDRFDADVHQSRGARDGADDPLFWKRPGYHNNFLFLPTEAPVPPAIDSLISP